MAGNAVGLGNFLRFPVQAVQNGGGAFMIPYLVSFLLMGIPLLWIEWATGRFGGRFGNHSTPFILHELDPKRAIWKYIGVFGIFTNIAVAAYYCYLESWTLSYVWHSVQGTFVGKSAAEVAGFFGDYVGLTDPTAPVLFWLLCLVLNTWILSRGLSGGVEKVAKIGMPLLILFGVFLAYQGITLKAGENGALFDGTVGLNFLWTPDYSTIWTPKVWLAAAGQIFFTLSVGMGSIQCYASYIKRRDDIALNAMSAGWMNEFVEVVLGGDTGQLISKAILTAGNPEGDVLWGVDNTFLTRAIEGEVFSSYTSPLTKNMAADVVKMTQPDGVVTPVDTGDVCINYDKKWFSERNVAPPQSLEDLALPEYKDLLVVQNPASSSPGLAFLLSTIASFGEDGWQNYWKKLRTNGVKVVDGWTEAYTIEFSGSSGKGSRPLVVSYASSPPAEVVYSDPPVSEPPTAVIDTTCFHQVEFAGILRGSKNEDAAKLLVDYLADTTFQSDLPLTLFVNPVNKNVVLPEVFTSFAAQPEKPYSMDPVTIEENRVTWVDTWSSIALR